MKRLDDDLVTALHGARFSLGRRAILVRELNDTKRLVGKGEHPMLVGRA